MSAEGAADPGAAGGASAWPRRLTAEAFGTFALLFIAVSGGEVSVAARAVAPGRLVAALIYAIGDVSGAHLNPAVSLAFTLKRLFPVRWLVPYWGSQIVGVWWPSWCVGSSVTPYEPGCRRHTSPAGRRSRSRSC